MVSTRARAAQPVAQAPRAQVQAQQGNSGSLAPSGSSSGSPSGRSAQSADRGSPRVSGPRALGPTGGVQKRQLRPVKPHCAFTHAKKVADKISARLATDLARLEAPAGASFYLSVVVHGHTKADGKGQRLLLPVRAVPMHEHLPACARWAPKAPNYNLTISPASFPCRAARVHAGPSTHSELQ